jgi:pimeloyl-ACP methyl ester carboxylesterase
MPDVTVNGVRLHYQESGRGSDTVVFSHSYLLDGSHFQPQMDTLAEHYRCIAYDHRGHGQSEKTRSGYDMENLYADAVAFIERVVDAPCHFVGLSTGGYVGLRLGFRRPDLLKTLVLMDTSADRDTKGQLMQYRFLLFLARFLGARFIAAQAFPFLFGKTFRRDSKRATECRHWLELIAANDRNAIIAFGKGIFARESVYEQIAAIRTPTLVVVGEEDISTPVSSAQRLARRIPEAELLIARNAGHVCTVENARAVTERLVSFLARHGGVGFEPSAPT